MMEGTRRWRRLAGLLVGGGIFFLLGIYSGRYLFPPTSDRAHPSQDQGGASPFTQAAALATPAVVNIKAEGIRGEGHRGTLRPWWERDPFFRDFFKRFQGAPGETDVEKSLGSGVIIDRRGYILTNNHVVEGARRITVRLATKEELKGRVVGRDPKTDLAVVRVESDRELPEAVLGDSDRLRVGEWALAIGNPFGLDHTVTVGVISATGRAELGVASYEHFIQTDASINPGNSGGPLLNVKGEIVGITTAIVASGQGIGFAIPINLARRIAQDLIHRGRVVRGWLGIGLGLSPDGGVLVTHVAPKGPAATAGLRAGDMIAAVGGQGVRTPQEVQRLVAEAAVGSTLPLTILRRQETLQLSVQVAEMPE